MANRSKVIDKDKGMKQFLAFYSEARGASVKVGVTESVGQKPKESRDDGNGQKVEALTLVLVAWFNEYGTIRTTPDGHKVVGTPARSFIRSTADESRQEFKNLSHRLVLKIIDGQLTVRQALGIMGEWMQAKIQRKITRLREPPNAASTIKAKNDGRNPLIDIGQLRQNIRFEIDMPNERSVV